MCGIAGVWSLKSHYRVNRKFLERMLEVMDHRGPDGRRVHIEQEGTWGLGHSLLAFTDMTSGPQPIFSKQGGLATVCNGEFYNYEQIFKCIVPEYSRHTQSDSELIIPLYQKLGCSLTQHLEGEFAFALVDQSRRRLLLFRDRFGVKPLFYYTDGEKLIFASEIKAIAAYLGHKLELDPEMAFNSAVLTPSSDRTVFRGVRQVLPGSYLTIENTSISTQKYFELSYPSADSVETNIDASEASDTVKTLLTQAVNRRLPTKTKAVSYLSGGIDSSIVFALMAEASSEPVRAYTVRFSDGTIDEAEEASELVKVCGGDHQIVDLNETQLVEGFESCLWHSESPISNHHATAKLLMNRRISSDGYRCALSGEGADEILCGYPSFIDDYYDNAQPSSVAGIWTKREHNVTNRTLVGYHSDETILAELEASLGYAPRFLTGPLATAKAGAEIFFEYERQHASLRRQIDIHADDLGPQWQLLEPATRSQALWKSMIFSNYHLSALGDRVEMGGSVEARLPFLDQELFRYIRRLPAALKVGNGIGKAILRDAFDKLIGTVAASRAKRAFLAPTAQYDGPWINYQLQVLHSGPSSLDGIFDRKAVAKILSKKSSISLDPGLERMITRLISLLVLERLFA